MRNISSQIKLSRTTKGYLTICTPFIPPLSLALPLKFSIGVSAPLCNTPLDRVHASVTIHALFSFQDLLLHGYCKSLYKG